MTELRTLSAFIAQHGGSIQTGPFGSQLHQHEYTETGVPVVMPKDIIAGRVNEGTVARVSESKAAMLSRHELKQDDIIFPRRGEISKCALIDEQQAGFLCGTGCLKIELPKDALHPRFIYYYLGLSQVVEWLERNAVGTTMLNLNTRILGGVKVPVMPLGEQERIADTLAAYDDLIQNNRRRITLLEQSARLLYREWFVHLRFPGHEHVDLIDGVPEGWELRAISDMFDTTSGGTPSRAHPEFFDGDINWVKTQELDELFIFDTEEHISDVALKTSAAKLFPEGTLLVSIYGGTNIGRTGLLAKAAASNQACVALMPKRKPGDVLFAQKWLQENREYMVGLGQGAAQTNINQQTLRSQKMLVPTNELLDEFADCIKPMYEQIANICQQNAKLREARHLLLPRLMSGEVEV